MENNSWTVRRRMMKISFYYTLAMLPAYAILYWIGAIDAAWINATAPFAMILVPALIAIPVKYIHDVTKDDIDQRGKAE